MMNPWPEAIRRTGKTQSDLALCLLNPPDRKVMWFEPHPGHRSEGVHGGAELDGRLADRHRVARPHLVSIVLGVSSWNLARTLAVRSWLFDRRITLAQSWRS